MQLLYLFGKSRPTPLYSIHDEDVLEYAHNVIARGSHAPTSFLGALQDRNLLLIGCNFPDWLSRFMLRATRKGRLAEPRAGANGSSSRWARRIRSSVFSASTVRKRGAEQMEPGHSSPNCTGAGWEHTSRPRWRRPRGLPP